MKKYRVTIKQVLSATEVIEGMSKEEAEDTAYSLWWEGNIELTDSGIPGDVEITVEELSEEELPKESQPNMEDTSVSEAEDNKIQIFWNDLTETKQAEILSIWGNNGNYDVFPIVEIPVLNEEEEET